MKYEYVGQGEFYHGIPARDLTESDWEQLTDAQKALIRDSKIYRPIEPKKRGK